MDKSQHISVKTRPWQIIFAICQCSLEHWLSEDIWNRSQFFPFSRRPQLLLMKSSLLKNCSKEINYWCSNTNYMHQGCCFSPAITNMNPCNFNYLLECLLELCALVGRHYGWAFQQVSVKWIICDAVACSLPKTLMMHDIISSLK